MKILTSLKVKKIIIKNSLEVILLIDSSKFGQVKSTHFAELNDIDKIITDDKIDDEWKEIIEDKGIDLIIA